MNIKSSCRTSLNNYMIQLSRTFLKLRYSRISTMMQKEDQLSIKSETVYFLELIRSPAKQISIQLSLHRNGQARILSQRRFWTLTMRSQIPVPSPQMSNTSRICVHSTVERKRSKQTYLLSPRLMKHQEILRQPSAYLKLKSPNLPCHLSEVLTS